jgi:biopolymer transport protein ExbB
MLGTIGNCTLLGLLGQHWELSLHFGNYGAMQDPTLLAAGVTGADYYCCGMIVAIPAPWLIVILRIIDINAQFETQAGLMIQELYDYQLLTIRIYLLCLSLHHSVADDQILGVLVTP